MWLASGLGGHAAPSSLALASTSSRAMLAMAEMSGGSPLRALACCVGPLLRRCMFKAACVQGSRSLSGNSISFRNTVLWSMRRSCLRPAAGTSSWPRGGHDGGGFRALLMSRRNASTARVVPFQLTEEQAADALRRSRNLLQRVCKTFVPHAPTWIL